MRAKRVESGKGKSRRKRARDTSPDAGRFIRVVHPAALHRRTLAVLNALERSEDPTAHREKLANLIIELTYSALDYCFMQPLRRTRPGYLLEHTASLGLAAAQQVIGPVIEHVIGHMDGKQLLSVSNSIRHFMR